MVSRVYNVLPHDVDSSHLQVHTSWISKEAAGQTTNRGNFAGSSEFNLCHNDSICFKQQRKTLTGISGDIYHYLFYPSGRLLLHNSVAVLDTEEDELVWKL